MSKIGNLTIREIGNSISLSGLVWIDNKNRRAHIHFYPSSHQQDFDEVEFHNLSVDQWKEVLRQSDVVETEILKYDQDKIQKTVVRKSQRMIEGYISWAVYQRDGYACRYCGITGIPLTVDHVDLWENGGASVEENLITACSKCNRLRGNTPYDQWIVSPVYHKRSKGLTTEQKRANLDVVAQLPALEKLRYINRRKR